MYWKHDLSKLSRKDLKAEVNNDGICRYYFKVKPGHWHWLSEDVYLAALGKVHSMEVLDTIIYPEAEE